MNSTLISTLRDKNTHVRLFRETADALATTLALSALDGFEKEAIEVDSPLGKTPGERFTRDVILIPILRSGLALMPAFLRVFPSSRVGMVGLKRDEHTAVASLYYENIPAIEEDAEVVLLDPMLATGGSATAAIEILLSKGVRQEQITGVFVISAPEGVQKVKSRFPKVRLVIAQEDVKLNANNFIHPGLGDFGDRYFGTE